MARRTRRIVVDSSAWLAYLADELGATHFSAAIEADENLVVPLGLHPEVFKSLSRQRGDGDALKVAALMQGLVIDLRCTLAIVAAKAGTDL